MPEFLVFAGTTEGRRLAEWLAVRGARVCVCVATSYGKTLLPEGVEALAERLDAGGMAGLLRSRRFDCVIDATHPYAALATQNIRAACGAAGTRLLRLLRPAGEAGGCAWAQNAEQAAELLCSAAGRVLLTTGSKELGVFTRVPDYQERIFVRVLPTPESIQRCLELGYRVQNILAMQGPFSREMNAALLRQIGAAVLVTKESGEAGGFPEKLAAAREAGAAAIVIGRPPEDAGLSFEELAGLLEREYGLAPPKSREPAPYFPLFISLSGRRVLLVGGGRVALRRAKTLLPFGPALTVVAPKPDPELAALGISVLRRPFREGDCAGYDFVLAATDSRETNRAVYEECRAAGIPVNVADAPGECGFYFPAIARRGPLVVGVTASGADHGLAKSAAKKIRARLDTLAAKEERDG